MTEITRVAISCVLEEACLGSRCVKVTFKREPAMWGLLTFLEMVGRGEISINSDAKTTLNSILHSGDWGLENSNVVSANLTPQFNAELFAERLQDYLELLEVVD